MSWLTGDLVRRFFSHPSLPILFLSFLLLAPFFFALSFSILFFLSCFSPLLLFPLSFLSPFFFSPPFLFSSRLPSPPSLFLGEEKGEAAGNGMGKQARGRERRTRQSWAARCVLYIARESSRRAWEDRIHEERRMRKSEEKRK